MPEINEKDLFKGLGLPEISEDSLFSGIEEAPAETTGVGDVQMLEQMDLSGKDIGVPLEERIRQAKIAAQRQENPILSALAPRQMARVANEEGGTLESFGASAGDVFSLAGRLVASSVDFSGDTWDDKIKNYLESVGKEKGDGFIDSVLRHPSTGAALLLAPYLAPMAGTGTAGALGAGAIEGSGIAALNQLVNLGENKELSPGEILLDLGTSLAMPGFGPAFKRFAPETKAMILKASKKVVNPVLKNFSSELSGISAEALELASSKGGRQKLIGMSGKAGELGDKLLHMLDNIDGNYKYEAQLKTALDDMPGIPAKNVRKSLESSIKNLSENIPHEAAARSKLEGYLEGVVKDYGTGSARIPASQFRKLRQKLDYVASFDKEGADLFNDALKKARHQAKDDLIGAAKGTPYEETMENYAGMLQARDKLYGILGKRSDTRQARIQGFMDNLFGKNKDYRQKALQHVDDIFGGSFSKDTKLASLASEIVKDGKFPLFASQTTGRSLKGEMGAGGQVALGMLSGNPLIAAGSAVTGGGTLAMSSPKVAPRLLEAERAMSQGLAGAPGIMSEVMNNPYLQRALPGIARVPFQNFSGDQ